jgi:uncharacterized protein YjbI with pentapeptide repeats
MTRKFIVKPRFFYESYGVDFHIEEMENVDEINSLIIENLQRFFTTLPLTSFKRLAGTNFYSIDTLERELSEEDIYSVFHDIFEVFSEEVLITTYDNSDEEKTTTLTFDGFSKFTEGIMSPDGYEMDNILQLTEYHLMSREFRDHLTEIGEDLSNLNTADDNLNDIIAPSTFFIGANFSNSSLNNASFLNANLICANFSNTTMLHADLRNTDLKNANFTDASLNNANFKNANLYQTNFRGADLTNADFRNAVLVNANLIGCKLNGAKFENSSWEDAIYDDDAMSLGDFEHYDDVAEAAAAAAAGAAEVEAAATAAHAEAVEAEAAAGNAEEAAIDIPIPALLQKQIKAEEEYDKEHPLKEAVWESETETTKIDPTNPKMMITVRNGDTIKRRRLLVSKPEYKIKPPEYAAVNPALIEMSNEDTDTGNMITEDLGTETLPLQEFFATNADGFLFRVVQNNTFTDILLPQTIYPPSTRAYLETSKDLILYACKEPGSMNLTKIKLTRPLIDIGKVIGLSTSRIYVDYAEFKETVLDDNRKFKGYILYNSPEKSKKYKSLATYNAIFNPQGDPESYVSNLHCNEGADMNGLYWSIKRIGDNLQTESGGRKKMKSIKRKTRKFNLKRTKSKKQNKKQIKKTKKAFKKNRKTIRKL